MALWDHPIEYLALRLDCRQFRFLTVANAHLYLAILIELHRARQQQSQHELSFESLFQQLKPIVESIRPLDAFEEGELRNWIHELTAHGNIATRVEPRRIRHIRDRGVQLILVRLTEGTNAILDLLESHFELSDQSQATSARFSLLEVDDALEGVVGLSQSSSVVSPEDLCRAGRDLFRARRAVEEAGGDLLDRELWLSETAISMPDRARLADLLHQLDTYYERYLRDIDQRRATCYEKLQGLRTDSCQAFLDQLQTAVRTEFEDDPTRTGRRPPDIEPILTVIEEFLRPGGTLDQRRLAVHQRLTDVVGHLKRHLAELVRRSHVTGALRRLSQSWMAAPVETFISDAENFMLDLWQPAQAVFDSSLGTPAATVTPPRPKSYRRPQPRGFPGATIPPTGPRLRGSSRPLLIKQMEDLNAFVQQAVLQGSREALISDAVLRCREDVRSLIAAVRMARVESSRLRSRYLRYSVSQVLPAFEVAVPLQTGDGRLISKQLLFTAAG